MERFRSIKVVPTPTVKGAIRILGGWTEVKKMRLKGQDRVEGDQGTSRPFSAVPIEAKAVKIDIDRSDQTP